KELARKLYLQRLAPLEQYLCAAGKLPAVQHLIVLPAGWMNAVPVEALTDQYIVSYAPSATLYARLQENRSKALAQGNDPLSISLLAVGDPVFAPSPPPAQPAPPPPDH